MGYSHEQAYLLPLSARGVLGADHACFFLRRVVAKLNLSGFRSEFRAEGGPAYAPEMLVVVWLHAYALSVTSSRRLEQRIREDLAFRNLAGGAIPDNWTLNAFGRQHRRMRHQPIRISAQFTRLAWWSEFLLTWQSPQSIIFATVSIFVVLDGFSPWPTKPHDPT